MARTDTLHRRACRLLGVDPEKVKIIGPKEWRELHGHTVSNSLGRASLKHSVVYVRRNAGSDTHVHEVLHILFPSRRHRWIYAATWKLLGMTRQQAYGCGGGLLASTGQCPESRAKVLRLAKASAKRRSVGA